MDINLLVLNVGNSRLAAGVFISGELRYVTRTSHENKADWPGVISELWKRIADRENPSIVGASVNPPLIEAIEHAVQQATGQEIEWIGREIELPIKVLTDKPAETGVDRVLNVAAA